MTAATRAGALELGGTRLVYRTAGAREAVPFVFHPALDPT